MENNTDSFDKGYFPNGLRNGVVLHTTYKIVIWALKEYTELLNSLLYVKNTNKKYVTLNGKQHKICIKQSNECVTGYLLSSST